MGYIGCSSGLLQQRIEAGFTHDGVVIHYGPADKRREVHLPAHKVKSNGMLKISRKYMVGEVEIEGLFVEVMGNMPYGFLGSVNANVRSGASCGRHLT